MILVVAKDSSSRIYKIKEQPHLKLLMHTISLNPMDSIVCPEHVRDLGNSSATLENSWGA